MIRPSDRTALAAILLLALAVRLWSVATHTYLVHPDETFQYLEPAHRLAFGSGVITWEFLDGIRSWLVPGLIAGVMRVAALIGDSPDAYVIPLRILCVLASLAVPYAGYRLAARHAGQNAGIAAGLLCALSPQAIYFAPVIMTEPLATDAALLAICVGDGARSTRRWIAAGLLFGLSAALRYQFAPILGLVALWQHVRDPRRFAVVAAAGAAVVLAVFGVLDWLICGEPFRSIWLNYLRNGPQGVSAAMGTEAPIYYLAYFLVSWGPLAPVLAVLLAFGAVRLPVLALTVAATIGLHSMVPHKELRFVFLATAVVPMLLGVGLVRVAHLLPAARRPGWAVTGAVACVVAGMVATTTTWFATRLDDWHRDRAFLQATAVARDVPGVCGVALRTVWVYRSGGYSYWHRDTPVYFETWDQAQKLSFFDFPLRLGIERRGQTVPQYPDAELAGHSGKFNVIVGRHTDQLPGFGELACFGAGTLDDSTWCVFTRPGGCD